MTVISQYIGNQTISFQIGVIPVPVAAGLSTVTVHLTSSQILNLNTSSVQILAAQGPKTVIYPVFCVARYNFVTTAYSVSPGNNFSITTAPEGNSGTLFYLDVASIGFVDQTQTTEAVFQSSAATMKDIFSNVENQALVVSMQQSNISTGNGTIDMVVGYQVITMP